MDGIESGRSLTGRHGFQLPEIQDYLQRFHSTLGFLQCLNVEISIVVFASRNIFWLIALQTVNVEDGSQAASIGPGGSFDTDVEFPAVSGVSMSAVCTRLVNVRWIGAYESFSNFQLVTSLDKVSPDTDPLFSVVGEAWWAFVSGGLTVPTGIEDAAVVFLGVDAVESGTVGSAYGRLKICPLSAVDTERISAVFPEGVNIVEDQAVAAQLQGGGAVFAGPVLVATSVVRVEAEVVRAVKFFPLTGDNSSQSNQKQKGVHLRVIS